MPRQYFNTPAERAAVGKEYGRRVAELMKANPSPLTLLMSAPTLPQPEENQMNEPIERKRMTSLDIKIDAAKRRAEAERSAVAPNPSPTQGMTSLLSTKEKDVPLVRTLPVLDMGKLAIDSIEQHPKPVAEVEGMCVALDVPAAMRLISQAMKADPDYARSWHNNIAMAVMDSSLNVRPDRRAANLAAAIFMQRCFGIDTSKHGQRVSEPVKLEDPIKVWYDGTSFSPDLLKAIAELSSSDQLRNTQNHTIGRTLGSKLSSK